MSSFVNIIAGRKAQHSAFIKMPILNVFNALYRGISIGQTGVSDVSVELVVLPAIPFGVNKKSKSVLKTKLLVAVRIFKLTFQLTR